jgi:hypothetical protein
MTYYFNISGTALRHIGGLPDAAKELGMQGSR